MEMRFKLKHFIGRFNKDALILNQPFVGYKNRTPIFF